MIRPLLPEDTVRVVELTAATGVFRSSEVDILKELLDDFHNAGGNADESDRAFACLVEDRIVGFIYHAPAVMTDRSWYLYWIAVDPAHHGQGLGTRLLAFAEEDARTQGGRVLFIETSALPSYEATRKFYLKQGYDLEATLRDYYADGDHMVVFRKRLTPA